MTAMAVVADDLISVPERDAARVVDVPVDRLRRWDRHHLVQPEMRAKVGSRSYSSYSLDEIVLGRVIRQLEDRGVHVTQITNLLDSLRAAIADHHPARLKWGFAPGEAFLQLPDGTWHGGKRPHQGVLIELLDLEAIRADALRRLARQPDEIGRITKVRGVHSSKPVFAGTRVPVDTVRRYIAAGMTDERILTSFPSLHSEDIEAVRRLIS